MNQPNAEGSPWQPFDVAALRAAGVGVDVGRTLEDPGLPVDCIGMFVRNAELELRVRDLPCGRAVCLGGFEDGVNSYWLVLGSGEVWMAYGYEGGLQRFALVNSSVVALQRMLRLWESFVLSGRSEDDEDYEDHVAELLDQAQREDRDAFSDDDAWWSRVFEEVELGVLGPE
ncbi:SUKH-4 family immunity protein [Kitasatospora fiedleri]|uniref:SUKH-4 family immunity protein n=1 Tax=Kitasatospora fiedleri TaxID=2991545 RepID=UPI00249AA95B|nr:SUKH-4 family immunity protein [Kitasatospora fiedleri]